MLVRWPDSEDSENPDESCQATFRVRQCLTTMTFRELGIGGPNNTQYHSAEELFFADAIENLDSGILLQEQCWNQQRFNNFLLNANGEMQVSTGYSVNIHLLILS